MYLLSLLLLLQNSFAAYEVVERINCYDVSSIPQKERANIKYNPKKESLPKFSWIRSNHFEYESGRVLEDGEGKKIIANIAFPVYRIEDVESFKKVLKIDRLVLDFDFHNDEYAKTICRFYQTSESDSLDKIQSWTCYASHGFSAGHARETISVIPGTKASLVKYSYYEVHAREPEADMDEKSEHNIAPLYCEFSRNQNDLKISTK